MTQATGRWTWARLDAGRSVVEITEAHIAEIRKLIAYWETAETGAACLADADFVELHSNMEPDFEAVLDVFMVAATLPVTKGRISNPYRHAGGAPRAILDDVPEESVRSLLLSGEDVDFEATPEELALWAEAYRQASGINPKRPFGSESVSRDIRAIIDPEKKLSNAAFGKKRKQLESRLVLLLQFFVQNATMAPGTWRRGKDWTWRLFGADEVVPAEELTEREWVQRMYSQLYYELQAYVETMRCLVHLVWENRLEGSYAELARQFKLETHFDDVHAEYEGRIEERLRAGLVHFPQDVKTADGEWWLTLVLVRLLNAQARFSEARDVLKKAGVFDLPAKRVDLSSINATGLLFLEGIITRRGLEIINEDAFQSVLFGREPRWMPNGDLWRFIFDVQRQPERFDDPRNLGLPHAQAVAVQLELMRGGRSDG
jgi:hypothetical protein